MKAKQLYAVVTGLCLLGLTLAPAIAGSGSPHFLSGPTASIQSDGSLLITAREAGLGNATTADVIVSASGVADYGCANNGSNIATSKETNNFSVSAGPKAFDVKNGTTSVSLSVSPPAADTVISCPGGQTAVIVSVTYQHDSYLDENSNIGATDFNVPQSHTFFHTKNGN